MNMQPSSPEPARPAGSAFHSMTPRKAPDLPPAISTIGWNPCFACGQTGHRQNNCAKYLQECVRTLSALTDVPRATQQGYAPQSAGAVYISPRLLTRTSS